MKGKQIYEWSSAQLESKRNMLPKNNVFIFPLNFFFTNFKFKSIAMIYQVMKE